LAVVQGERTLGQCLQPGYCGPVDFSLANLFLLSSRSVFSQGPKTFSATLQMLAPP